ncbi:MAG: hypothetical protein JSS32_07575 [Verrucomicrobia bacterium]|nr:hypothetical protein [Verrucomicrobiota bacterium]
MNAVDTSTLASKAQQHFLVRSYSYNTGETKYVKAIGRAHAGTISLVFKATTKPLENMLKGLNPVVVDLGASPTKKNFSDCRGIALPEDITPDIEVNVGAAIDLENGSVNRVLINMAFDSFEEFSNPNSLDPCLIAGVAQVCRKYFPALNADESAFNVKIENRSYRFDEVLKRDDAPLDIRFTTKYAGSDNTFKTFKV